MSKLAICVRADNNIKPMTDMTFPIIKHFAKEWNADFIKLAHDSEVSRHYRIMELYKILKVYDRVISLDADCVICPGCPDLFKSVPEEKIGTIYEDKGSRMEERHKRIQDIQKGFGNVGWVCGYINSGVMVVSRLHRSIFEMINGKLYPGEGLDDPHLGYQINKYKFQIHELPFQFNHMTMFSEGWNGHKNRFDSYIIHYAGVGVFTSGVRNRVVQIRNDIQTIYPGGIK